MDENLSLMMVPYKPKEIPDSTDLNIAPLNWLRPIGSTIRPPQKKSKEKRSKKTKMKSSIVANHYLKSHFMGSSQKTLNGVNAVADADTIKNLIKLGKEGLLLQIHTEKKMYIFINLNHSIFEINVGRRRIRHK